MGTGLTHFPQVTDLLRIFSPKTRRLVWVVAPHGERYRNFPYHHKEEFAVPRQSIQSFLDGRTVITLTPDGSVRQAAAVMAEHSIGVVPALHANRLVGVFSERDLLIRVVARGLDPESTTLDQVMTREPQAISAEETLYDALETMQAGGFRHLPVMSGGRVIGMLSTRDVPLDVVLRRHKFHVARTRRPSEYPPPHKESSTLLRD
jgi:CBS domain-containing protein